MILAGIVDEIKVSQFFSVMANEVSSHNVEHLPISLRFVDINCDIREELILLVLLNWSEFEHLILLKQSFILLKIWG